VRAPARSRVRVLAPRFCVVSSFLIYNTAWALAPAGLVFLYRVKIFEVKETISRKELAILHLYWWIITFNYFHFSLAYSPFGISSISTQFFPKFLRYMALRTNWYSALRLMNACAFIKSYWRISCIMPKSLNYTRINRLSHIWIY
jgi:hypothetical protein